jgi:hypothetical protein
MTMSWGGRFQHRPRRANCASLVMSDNDYSGDPIYYDSNRNMTEPMGRASAVVVCGHSDDTANDIGSLGQAICLTEWWFGN